MRRALILILAAAALSGCSDDPLQLVPASNAPSTPEVSGSNHAWTAKDLNCRSVVTGVIDYVPGAAGVATAELVDAATTDLRAKPGDTVEPGRPGAKMRTYRLVRGGDTVAVVSYSHAGANGTWLRSQFSSCG